MRALNDVEMEQAERYGYISNAACPSQAVNRSGIDISFEDRHSDELSDWRVRMYLIWLCYIYEKFRELKSPLGAIEELILEFRAPTIIDRGYYGLGQIYVGAGAEDPITRERVEKELITLQPFYEEARQTLARIIPD
ncbi:hypothetical protein [Rhodoblastus sp.]|uniref:hypothetical protein n=1 Tax=Rhodoblastus sp. TaxID=1962975 RepID=UPI0035B37DD3